MTRPNFRWFGSGEDAVVFDVDDVSSVSFACEVTPVFSAFTLTSHTIRIDFYHRASIEVLYTEHSRIEYSAPAKYQQVYDWAKNELVSNPEVEVKEE